jgi:hypothetical protein
MGMSFAPTEGENMNLLSVLDSAWFSFSLGGMFIFFAVARVYRGRQGIAGWVGSIVFTFCSLAFIYNGFLRLHRG